MVKITEETIAKGFFCGFQYICFDRTFYYRLNHNMDIKPLYYK